ncbi:MAG: DUF2202 domain-containing protein [Chloroflexota bacterium]
MRLHGTSRTLGITASMLTVALLVPAAVLAAGPRDGSCDPAGAGPKGPAASAPRAMNGQGMGTRGMGAARMNQSHRAGDPAAQRRGAGQGIRQAAPGVLTADQQLDLAAMAQEEKLAHDLYTQLGSTLGGPELARIAAAETNHLTAVRTLLARYGVDDPTAGLAAGVFADEAFQQLYDRLLAQGSPDLAAAYDVGVIVEQDDLARLADAKVGVTAQDVLRVYANLAAGSERHLAAFSAL